MDSGADFETVTVDLHSVDVHQPHDDCSLSSSKDDSGHINEVPPGPTDKHGLPYHDHNYGAPLPSQRASGRVRILSMMAGINGQGLTRDQTPIKQAILQQHQGNQVAIRGQSLSTKELTPISDPRVTVEFSSSRTTSANNERNFVGVETPTVFRNDARQAIDSNNDLQQFTQRLKALPVGGKLETCTPSTVGRTFSRTLLSTASAGSSSSALSQAGNFMHFPGFGAVPIPMPIQQAARFAPPQPISHNSQQQAAFANGGSSSLNFQSATNVAASTNADSSFISPASRSAVQKPTLGLVNNDVVLSSILTSPPPQQQTSFNIFHQQHGHEPSSNHGSNTLLNTMQQQRQVMYYDEALQALYGTNYGSSQQQQQQQNRFSYIGRVGRPPILGGGSGVSQQRSGSMSNSISTPRLPDPKRTTGLYDSLASSGLPAQLRAAGVDIVSIELPDDPTIHNIATTAGNETVESSASGIAPSTATSASIKSASGDQRCQNNASCDQRITDGREDSLAVFANVCDAASRVLNAAGGEYDPSSPIYDPLRLLGVGQQRSLSSGDEKATSASTRVKKSATPRVGKKPKKSPPNVALRRTTSIGKPPPKKRYRSTPVVADHPADRHRGRPSSNARTSLRTSISADSLSTAGTGPHPCSNTDTDDEAASGDSRKSVTSTSPIVKRLLKKPLALVPRRRSGGQKLSSIRQPVVTRSDDEVEERLSISSGDDEEVDEEYDDWDGQEDYTTKCLCEMKHNDDFMIQCEKCEVWQHCDCLGLKKRSIPDKYLCHFCQPRKLPLSREQAKCLQMKKRATARHEVHRRKKAKLKRMAGQRSNADFVKRTSGQRMTIKQMLEQRKQKTGVLSQVQKLARSNNSAQLRAEIFSKPEHMEEFYLNYSKNDNNEYTEDVFMALQNESDTIGSSLLDQLPIGTPCLVMHVTKERRGLVANLTIPPDQPILEYRGRVCSVAEFSGRQELRVLPYILFYRGLLKGDGSSASQTLDLCIDARFKGTEARFVRRSCQPNAQVKHVIKNGELHLLLISTELIESTTEVTIPFDYDFRSYKYNVECACTVLRNDDCPVSRANAQRKKIMEENQLTGVKEESLDLSPAVDTSPTKNLKTFKPSTTRLHSQSKSSDKDMKQKAGPAFKVKLKLKASSDNKVQSDQVKHESKIEESVKKTPKKQQPKHSKSVSTKKEPKREVVRVEDIEDSKLEANSSQISGDSDSREEKKMKLLMQQIARIEEREKKRAEKRRESTSSGGAYNRSDDSPKKSPKKKGRKSLDETKAETQDHELCYSEQRSESAEFHFSSPYAQTSSLSFIKDDRAGQHTNFGSDRNIAKKRWLRQALSDEIFQQNSLSTTITSSPIAYNKPTSDGLPFKPTDKDLKIDASTALDFTDNAGYNFDSARQLTSDNVNQSMTLRPHKTVPVQSMAVDSAMPFDSLARDYSLLSEVRNSAPLVPGSVATTLQNPLPQSIYSFFMSSAAEQSFSLDSFNEQQQQSNAVSEVVAAKKKVRMSLDEYKKRKSSAISLDNGNGANNTSTLSIENTSLTTTPIDEESTITPTGCGDSTPSTIEEQKTTRPSSSFIPQLKESGLAQSIRLATLPDPTTIGKGSTSFEDLRKRIYGHSLSSAGVEHQTAISNEIKKLNTLDASDVAINPPRPRMSLMDRLKTEFGLDEGV